MKALIGLDRYSDPTPILDLFGRLGFADCSVTVANVLEQSFPAFEPMLVPSGAIRPMAGAAMGSSSTAFLKRQAERLLSEAREVLFDQGIHSDTKIMYGYPAEALMRTADDMGVDLIGAASTTSGPIRTAIFGSVCRALTIGSHESVLIAKGSPKADKPLTAVLATDHSFFCDRAIARLLEMNPMGIQKLTVLTSIESKQYAKVSQMYDLPESEPEFDRWDPNVVWQRNEEIAAKFQRLSIKTDVAVLETSVRQAINNVMAEHQADLLILAAQGHGFFERMTIGSLSLHEAVAENHSLLILRPSQDALKER